jgi:hypothetical protein
MPESPAKAISTAWAHEYLDENNSNACPGLVMNTPIHYYQSLSEKQYAWMLDKHAFVLRLYLREMKRRAVSGEGDSTA